jgi:secreted protein with Ig-like and vWFA domain
MRLAGALGLLLLLGCGPPSLAAPVFVPPAPAIEPPRDEPSVAAPAEPAPRRPSALALVIDRSGSMTGAPIELSRKACHDAVNELDATDHVAVIAFDSQAGIVGTGEAAHAGIDRIQPGGGTEIFSALERAYEVLVGIEGAQRRLLLLSDGQAPTEGIAKLVRQMRGDGIVISTVGLGDHYDRALLEAIAAEGGGRFHAVAAVETLPTVFRDEVIRLMATPDEVAKESRE